MAIQLAFTTATTALFQRLTAFGRVGPTWRPQVGMALLLGLVLVGCRSPQPSDQATPPPPTAPAAGPTEPPADRPTEPVPRVNPPPTAAPEAPVAQAPSTTAPNEPLPDGLVKAWEPMSNVLLVFGPMTVTAGDITWGSGQTSPYTLISRENGFLLKLEASPRFYDTANPYVKLIPQTDESGSVTSVEVAFYEGEAQAQRDEYIMYGSYFVN